MIHKIISEDLELKQLEISDSEALFSLTDLNREYLKNWLPWLNGIKTSEDSKNFIISSTEKYNGNKSFELGIWYKNQLAGVIGIHEVDWEKEQTAIGYWLGESFQGTGIITQSTKFIINHIFNELNLKKIYIRCATENTKSRNIPERLNFKFIEVRELSENLYGKLVDHAIYGLTEDEYLKDKNKFKL